MLHRKTLLRRIGVIALIAMLGSILLGLVAAMPAKAAPPPLTLDAKSVILLDYETGQVLFEQNADTPLAPASLTKLMTLHLVYNKLEAGQLKKDEKVNISTNAWAATMPGSSLMFLEPGQIVTVGELMKGLAIPSGNDAAVALAEHIGGNVDAFVAMMNKEAQDLGFKEMHFADPAGLSPQNQVTARQYAEFARIYIRRHDGALTDLHSVKEFTYPQPGNLAPGKQSPPVTQYNRNTLLGEAGVDGLKTGFIDESGYNMAVTAKQGEMRLIGIVLGVQAPNEAAGSEKRAAEARALLTWGYQNFITVKPTMPEVKPVRVWKGAASELTPVLPNGVSGFVTVAKGQETKLTGTVHQDGSVTAPVKAGQKLGELIFAADGQEVAKFDLVAATEVKQGGFFKRMWDSVRLTVSGWFTKKK